MTGLAVHEAPAWEEYYVENLRNSEKNFDDLLTN
jgi:hypothetical protein